MITQVSMHSYWVSELFLSVGSIGGHERMKAVFVCIVMCCGTYPLHSVETHAGLPYLVCQESKRTHTQISHFPENFRLDWFTVMGFFWSDLASLIGYL